MSDQTNDSITIHSPATGEVLGEIIKTPIERIPEIYDRARQAFVFWSQLSLQERLKYFRHLRFYMIDHLEEIIQTISRDTGKVPVEAITADVMPVLDGLKHIEKHAPKILKRQKKPTPLLLIGKKSYIEYMPCGVVLVISPWNYPLQLAMIPVISALVSGNSVILKPSEVTPLVGKLIEELFTKSGFPKDVIQVVHGDQEQGAMLTSAKPDYIFFTGSVRTGKIIQAQAAKELIPTTLELGGKDPMIVFADANLNRAAQGAIWGAFTNSGQVCMSVERLYVEEKIYDKFVNILVNKALQLNQGIDLNDDIGSMTFSAQCNIVKEQLKDAVSKGAKLLTGTMPEEWSTEKGMFIPPIILTNISTGMKLVNEETFGPLLPIIPFDSEAGVIKLANDSNFGLNASVWSSDLEKAERVAAQLVSGSVVINDVIISIINPYLPFGGAKESGLGKYHAEVGLRTFCHEKSIMIDRGKKPSEIGWYPYKGKYPHLLELFKNLFGKKTNWANFLKTYFKLMKK